MSEATDKLKRALDALHETSIKQPLSAALQRAWPGIGIAWASHWVEQIARDLKLTNELIERAASSSAPADDGRIDLEYAFWRLASARDKLRIVIALVVGPVRLQLTGRESVPKFRPSWKKTRQKLMTLDSEHAKRVVELDEEADKRLLLRHQTSHSLAPITGTQSLLWIEIGNVEAGKIVGYEGVSLTPEGAADASGITVSDLFGRALDEAGTAKEAIEDMAAEVALLVADLGDIELPTLVWRVAETDEVFLDQEEALAASRRAKPE